MNATKTYCFNFQFHALQKSGTCSVATLRSWADLRWKRAKASSTAGRDTPQRARLGNTKMEITCLIFWRLLLEVICCGKFYLNLTDQMLFVLFFIALCLTLRGHEACLSVSRTLISCCLLFPTGSDLCWCSFSISFYFFKALCAFFMRLHNLLIKVVVSLVFSERPGSKFNKRSCFDLSVN